MYVSPRFSAKQAVVVGLLFAFTGFATPAIDAEGKHSKDLGATCSCNSTSAANPKDIKEAQKEVDKAQKEFARACKAQQHAALRAQREKDQAKANAELEKYNVRLEQKQCALSQAQARLNSLEGNTAVAQNTQETQTTIAVPEPAPAVQASEPEQAPLPPATPEVEQSTVTPPATPPATESTESVATNTQSENTTVPSELPKTAGSLDLLGLIGLLSMGGSLSIFLRR
jgi:hypothetical protein